MMTGRLNRNGCKMRLQDATATRDSKEMDSKEMDSIERGCWSGPGRGAKIASLILLLRVLFSALSRS